MSEPGQSTTTPGAMSAIFAPETHVQYLLVFEAALARAEARAGIIPVEAAEEIASCCHMELFDVKTLYQQAALAGTPVIPLVKMLTARVEAPARRFVHWGATSQDAIDTALMLQMREGLNLLGSSAEAICASCAQLAEQHRHTLMAGRTLMQQALPITFGLKAAHWLAQVTRQARALRAHRQHTLAVQFGGAAGTLAALGASGPRVARLLAEELHLTLPELPWHTERDRVAEIAATLGIVAGSMAKIARDIILLAQTEVGEVAEGSAPGKGGSSAMPQKHNPVDSITAVASARLALGLVPVIFSALPQEHERAAGGWQTEWQALPALFEYTASAVEHMRAALAGLQVDPARMRANLEITRGLIMAEALATALAGRLGKPEAYRLVETLSKQVSSSDQTLLQATQASAQVKAAFTSEELASTLDPTNYLGSTDIFIDRALASYRKL
ncbi:MAG TPA: 3-carboxy-cis,cis-muconate cycloisomerase [Ktedonobacteraceae bacterium]